MEESELDDIGEEELDALFRAAIVMFILVVLMFGGSIAVNGWLFFGGGELARSARGWFSEWWPLVVLYLLPSTLLHLAAGAFENFRDKFDYEHPDDMDLHTGEWLEERLGEMGVDGGVKVGGVHELLFRGVDAFDPARDIIFLSDKTYRKRDPMFWSIGAHELGHALVHRKHAWWSWLNIGARRLHSASYTYLPIWLLANAVVGFELLTNLLAVGIWLGFGAGLLVCADEWMASRRAVQFMREDQRVSDEAVADIRVLLGSAFATYLSPVVAFAVYLAAWPWLYESYSAIEYVVTPAPDGTARFIALGLAGAIAALALVRGARWLQRRANPNRYDDFDFHEFLDNAWKSTALGFATSLAVAGLVWLTWNVDFGLSHRVALVLAVPQLGGALNMVALPIGLLLFLPKIAIRKAIGTPPEDFESEPDEVDGEKRFKFVDPERTSFLSELSVGGVAFALPLVVITVMSLF